MVQELKKIIRRRISSYGAEEQCFHKNLIQGKYIFVFPIISWFLVNEKIGNDSFNKTKKNFIDNNWLYYLYNQNIIKYVRGKKL